MQHICLTVPPETFSDRPAVDGKNQESFGGAGGLIFLTLDRARLAKLTAS